MAIQNRRGIYNDFDPDKLLPGEWAVVTEGEPDSENGESVYMRFNTGSVKRMATYNDMLVNINNATKDVQSELLEAINQTILQANNAILKADEAANAATTATTKANAAAAKAEEVYGLLKDFDASGAVEELNNLSTAIKKLNNALILDV